MLEYIAHHSDRPPKVRPLGRELGIAEENYADFQGQPAKPAVNVLSLRCVSQACHPPSQQGHFALAAKPHYHHTSPMRRYSDLTSLCTACSTRFRPVDSRGRWAGAKPS
ncbi:MAG: RNB domain-containing ribonuclease [Phycisphaerae bacterium]